MTNRGRKKASRGKKATARQWRLWSGAKVGMPDAFGGKSVPIRTTPYVEAGMRALKNIDKAFGNK